MKKLAIALVAALTLSSSAVAGLHGGVGFRFGGGHYGHWHGGGRFWAPFGLGLGLGALFSWPLYWGPDYYCAPDYDFWYAPPPYRVYSYVPAPPAPLYDPPVVRYGATVPIPDPPRPRVSASTAWVPTYKGAGRWVPDATPYSYEPGREAKRPGQPSASEAPRVVTFTHSAGGVPLYIVGR
jgi:hypothetical protein